MTGDGVFEVEVQCLFAGSVEVEADDYDHAVEIVKDLPDEQIIRESMTPDRVHIRGVYSLD